MNFPFKKILCPGWLRRPGRSRPGRGKTTRRRHSDHLPAPCRTGLVADRRTACRQDRGRGKARGGSGPQDAQGSGRAVAARAEMRGTYRDRFPRRHVEGGFDGCAGNQAGPDRDADPWPKRSHTSHSGKRGPGRHTGGFLPCARDKDVGELDSLAHGRAYTLCLPKISSGMTG